MSDADAGASRRRVAGTGARSVTAILAVRGKLAAVIGVVILVVAFLIGIPLFLMSMGVIGGILGTFLKDDAEERYEGSELIKLNK